MMADRSERPLLYISGPYSPIPGRTIDTNIEIATAYAVAAWERGWAALCPHLNTARFDRRSTLPYLEWIAGDLVFIQRMVPARDALLMLPRWNESAGARAERDYAIERGIVVYEAPPDGMWVPDIEDL